MQLWEGKERKKKFDQLEGFIQILKLHLPLIGFWDA